jgi:anhydro-N-acetylmuramic acid kinase
MSGTSLDGVDLAFCRFHREAGKWDYTIEAAETVPYPAVWKERLESAERSSALEISLTDAEYGRYLGKLAKEFLRKYNLDADFIASHGHTIFHQPEKGMTLQIGKGSALAAESGFMVVNDFRSQDVSLGGQGAPLVPVGDRLLFGEYGYCLNLGGFANISYDAGEKRIAFDICPVNIVMNRLAGARGQAYDRDGLLARKGSVVPGLVEKLNDLLYYEQQPPKSLGKEWVISHINPLLDKNDESVEDLLTTFCEHIAEQIARCTDPAGGMVLATGGGALNTYLMERIRAHAGNSIIVPDLLTVNFKEALIFAFLGVLRIRNEVNVLASVTGASRDHSSGVIWFP